MGKRAVIVGRETADIHESPPRFFRQVSINVPATVTVLGSTDLGSMSALPEREQGALLQDWFVPAGSERDAPARIRASKAMTESRRIGPLLVYGGLAAFAVARREWEEGTRAVETSEWVRKSYERVRTPYRTQYPPPDKSNEAQAEFASLTQLDPEKRPREQIENDQPASTQVRRAKEQGRGRRATAPWQIPWAGWKDIFWRVYDSVIDNACLRSRAASPSIPCWRSFPLSPRSFRSTD